MDFSGFIYGNLSERFPEHSYSQLKTIRLTNWGLFKDRCNQAKLTDGNVNVISSRLEMFVPEDESILLENGQSLTIQGVSKATTELVFFPLTPIEGVNQNIFNLEINTALTINDATVKRDKIKKYETYSCVLKKSSNSKLVQVLGTIRPDFWDDLEVGKTLFYGWAFETQGATNTIASWDEGAKTITLTNNISGSVSNDDQSGTYVKFGMYFKEDISYSDYDTYGDKWYIAEGMNFVYHSYSLTDQPDTVITYANVIFSGAEYNTYIGSGACKVYATDTKFTKCQIGLAFFGQDKGNNQQLHYNNLTFDDCGYEIAGGITTATASNILGSGAYLHPSIAVKKIGDGNLILTNNIAGAFRQFSSSGTKPIASGSTSEFGIIVASGNSEYDLITSNSMPVTIDSITSENIVNGGGTGLVINGGSINKFRLTSQAQPDSGVTDIQIQINNCDITDLQQFGWSTTQQGNTTLTYNDCIFYSKKSSDLSYMFESEGFNLKQLNIIGGSYVKGVDGGDYYIPEGSLSGLLANSTFIRLVYFKGILFQNFNTEDLLGNLFGLIQYYRNSELLNTYQIEDSEINLSALYGGGLYYYRHSYQFNLIRTVVKNSCIGSLGNNNISTQKTASRAASIVSSDSYALWDDAYSSLSDVLELDYENNEYTVSAGNVKVAGPLQYRNINGTLRKCVAANALGNEVIIHATGGDVVFQAFNASTNPKSNIKNEYTCLNGESCKLVPGPKEVLSTSADSSTSEIIGVGNGVTTIFHGELGDPDPPTLLKVVGSASLTAGSVTGSIDSDGIITGTGIEEGQIDFFGPSYYVKFTTPPPSATNIRFDFDLYNGHKFTGSLTVAAL